MKLDYTVATSISGDIITQEVSTENVFLEGTRDVIWRCVVNTREQQLREALIALGWTPPATSADPRDAAPAPAEHQAHPR